MKLMQQQQEYDRRDKAEQKSKASVANPLNFGANVVHFQPPPPSKGGWGWARIDTQKPMKGEDK